MCLCKGTWHSIATEINTIVNESMLGQKMFGFALDLLVLESWEKQLMDIVHEMKAGEVTKDLLHPRMGLHLYWFGLVGLIGMFWCGLLAHFTHAYALCWLPQDRLQTLRAKAAYAAQESGISKGGAVKRTVVMSFMGLDISLLCRDVNEEINLRFGCFLKAESIGRPDGLSPLFFEAGLLENGVSTKPCNISADVLQDFKTARMAAHDLIQQEAVLTGDMLQQLLASREALYLQIDSSFAIEFATVKALAGHAGERRLQKAILELFPSEAKQRSLQQVSADLARLASSELHRIVTRSAQTSLEVVREILEKMLMGDPPEAAAFGSGGFMQEVGLHMSYFMTFTVHGSGGKPSKVLSGKQAYSKKFDIIAARHSEGKKENMTLFDLEELAQFIFLATDGQKEILHKMVLAAAQSEKKGGKGSKGRGAKASSASSAAASTAAPSSSKADKLKQAKADAEAKHVMSLFD